MTDDNDPGYGAFVDIMTLSDRYSQMDDIDFAFSGNATRYFQFDVVNRDWNKAFLAIRRGECPVHADEMLSVHLRGELGKDLVCRDGFDFAAHPNWGPLELPKRRLSMGLYSDTLAMRGEELLKMVQAG